MKYRLRASSQGVWLKSMLTAVTMQGFKMLMHQSFVSPKTGDSGALVTGFNLR